MKNQTMTVRPSSYRRGRNRNGIIFGLAILGLVGTGQLFAQGLPPLPEPGSGTKLTPEELARIRAEAEARAKERATHERYLKEITILPLEAFSTNKTAEAKLLSVEALLAERKERSRDKAAVSAQKSRESMERA